MPVTPALSPAILVQLVLLTAAVTGISHVVTLLELPSHSRDNAFARIQATVPLDKQVALSNSGSGPASLPFGDPAMATAVCRFDLRQSPFQVAISPFDTGFVTIGFHSRNGLAFYGLTVHAADATRLDLVVSDKSEARGDPSDSATATANHAVAVVSPDPEGFVLMSTPLGDGIGRAEADERLAHIGCGAGSTATP
ncbi:hypothetical protein [Lichenifustis flavocetrariae]|uniref:DUF1254 domain-containing protein n=1 Tax=Lichenifustis flavocetrariae TaxID=2949735 RepID=A0AA41YZ63_9HYPH|nr:hypothetical protein [Lichenifustis flavocetrariae]MCW6507510.1 hypothetical protein [Lichenifustis flavocetrariae]